MQPLELIRIPDTTKRLQKALEVLNEHRQEVFAYAWEHKHEEVIAWAKAQWGITIGHSSFCEWIRQQPDYDHKAAHYHKRSLTNKKPVNEQFAFGGLGKTIPMARPVRWPVVQVTDAERLREIRTTLEQKLAAGRAFDDYQPDWQVA